MRRLLPLIPLALPLVASAQDFRAWQGAQEGQLIEASEGDLTRAIAWYEGLILGLPADDPTLGALHFSLGRALYTAGDSAGARAALESALEYPEVALQAQALLSQIDAQELRVRSLPLEEDFDSSTGPWLHSWEYAGKGRIEVRPPPGSSDPALAWSTEVSQRQDDQLRVGFSLQDETPERFSLSLRSESFPAYLMVVLYDDEGHSWTLPNFIIAPTGAWAQVDVELSEFVSLPLETTSVADAIGPGELQALVLRDVTAYYSSDQGSNVIFIDQVRVR
ncbi:MAG: tetratricopeptide repeat protein [Alphaproteobacteria bacterium]|nr:tetratricopeptide repeat protein [Alphaproteobacteria bacterium]MCB9794445.1 tetratricopeptide repeat protein [Alphaproteobacteria bacterium]